MASVIASQDSVPAVARLPYRTRAAPVIKVHGDTSTRGWKNTTEEVGSYDAAMNRLLDQVFKQGPGLIVCGWSGEGTKSSPRHRAGCRTGTTRPSGRVARVRRMSPSSYPGSTNIIIIDGMGTITFLRSWRRRSTP